MAANLGADRLIHEYLEAKADPNVVDHYGTTAFSRAAYRGHTKAIHELSESTSYLGFDHTQNGMILAFTHAHKDLVELLMKQPGFDIHTESVQNNFLKIAGKNDEKYQEVLSC